MEWNNAHDVDPATVRKRRAQTCPEGVPNPPWTLQKHPKFELRGVPESQHAPKRRPRPARRCPRGLKKRPRGAQERPRSTQECPRGARETPGRPPEPPRSEAGEPRNKFFCTFLWQGLRERLLARFFVFFRLIFAYGVRVRTLNFIAPVDVFKGFSRMDVVRAMSLRHKKKP